MDQDYWKRRCAAAEDALRRARSKLWLSPPRFAALAVLADLRPRQTLTTAQIAQRLGVAQSTAQVLLVKLERIGLVDRSAKSGCNHRPVHWRLGHMVVIQELDPAGHQADAGEQREAA